MLIPLDLGVVLGSIPICAGFMCSFLWVKTGTSNFSSSNSKFSLQTLLFSGTPHSSVSRCRIYTCSFLEAWKPSKEQKQMAPCRKLGPAERGWRFDDIFSPGFWLLGPTSRTVVIKNRHPSGVFKAPKAINGQHQDPQDSKKPPELG